MGSTRQEDRSLGSGISLPQWMKGKMENRFDFDESTFSPPSHDDSFFYIRYPKSGNQSTQSDSQGRFRPVDAILSESKTKVVTAVSQQSVSDTKQIRELDFSKHPLPCQPYIPATAGKGNDIGVKPSRIALGGTGKVKPQGTDDGFHSEPALCGKSIVHVANQMMSSKFTKNLMAAEQSRDQLRKGSKSLPATPLTSPITSPDSSPKARRRLPGNRYFTGPFLPDREKYQGGWILGSLLGQSREIIAPKIDEEDETAVADVPPPRLLSRKKSISSQNLTYIGNDEKTSGKTGIHTSLFQAKPSELREMNFWSPTSM